MQNSGLGNALNPLASVVDPEVYGIPMLLIIGWRGEINEAGTEQIKDEPQHRKQGWLTLPWLTVSSIPYEILPNEIEKAEQVVEKLVERAYRDNRAVAIVVRKNSFSPYQSEKNSNTNTLTMSREEAISVVTRKINSSSPIISTTGMISRELFEIREINNEPHNKDFLVVGAMGHASSIAAGVIAGQSNDYPVYCFDGDGSSLMHMGSMAIIQQDKYSHNFKHIIFNNGAHDSVGGQQTVGLDIDFCGVANALGYKWSDTASNEKELIEKLSYFEESKGPSLLVINVKKGNRSDLGRPTLTSQEIKKMFKEFLQK